jgi:hypothetical protein
MKKGITILIAAMVLSIAFSGVAAAGDYDVEVGSNLKIVGVGTLDRELLAQSEWGFGGQKVSESTYTKWIGTDGISKIDYTSDLNLFIGMSDEHEDTNVTEISYAQTSGMTNMRSTMCSRNFEAGVASGFTTVGTSVKSFEINMYPDSNSIDFEGAINGSARFRHVVVDPVTRLKVVKEITDVEGEFSIDWRAYGDLLSYPGDEGDYLGCP